MNRVVRFKVYIGLDVFTQIKKHLNENIELNKYKTSLTKRYDNVDYEVIFRVESAGKNYLNVITEVFGDRQLLYENKNKISNIEDLFYVQVINTDKNIDICIAFELDNSKNIKYYINKRDIHYYLTQETAYYVYHFAVYSSLIDKIERIEILYCILIKKISSGRYGHIEFKKYLLESLEFLGYNKDFIVNYEETALKDADEVPLNNTDEVFDYLMYIMLCNLNKIKNVKMPKYKKIKELNNLYDLYFKFLNNEGYFST